jgi:hypothetical protein
VRIIEPTTDHRTPPGTESEPVVRKGPRAAHSRHVFMITGLLFGCTIAPSTDTEEPSVEDHPMIVK